MPVSSSSQKVRRAKYPPIYALEQPRVREIWVSVLATYTHMVPMRPSFLSSTCPTVTKMRFSTAPSPAELRETSTIGSPRSTRYWANDLGSKTSASTARRVRGHISSVLRCQCRGYALPHVHTRTMVRSWVRSDTCRHDIRCQSSQGDEGATHPRGGCASVGFHRSRYHRSGRCSVATVGTTRGAESD